MVLIPASQPADWSAVDAGALQDQELISGLREIVAAENTLAGLKLRVLAQIDTRGLAKQLGSKTTGDWFANTGTTNPGTAKRMVHTAVGLEALPTVAQALRGGEISAEHAAAIVTAMAAIDRAAPELDESVRAAAIETLLSLQSHERAAAAIDGGRFVKQITPVTLPDGAVFSVDEGVRRGGTVDSLGRLKTVFAEDGVVTAGNASQISDGAAALLMMTGERARQLGLTPLARVHAATVVGDDPVTMLAGPIPATAKVLRMAGLRLDDIGAFEVNEAFASVVGAWLAETGASPELVNPNGRSDRARPSPGRLGRLDRDHSAEPYAGRGAPVRAADHV